MKNIPPAYDAKQYEDLIYKKWEKSGAFKPKIDSKKKPFVISMPPPNATGTLHLGHATMLAIEDIMARYHRMKGDPTLWLPGTDHASIATQNKVEQLLAKEGKTRHSLGRELFLKEVHEFVENSQHIIRNQIRKMGSSCDWSRERYTLDKGLTEAVREAFIRMYDDGKGVICRDWRIVNWCPRCESTLADDEVNHKEIKGAFYHIKYELKDGGSIIIATTRPETMLGDVAVAVNPNDKRYKKLIGKMAILPILKRELLIIGDSHVDQKLGTGALKVTPAHDLNDFEIMQRHKKLWPLKIFSNDGKINEHGGKYAGQDRFVARKNIIEDLEKIGNLIKTEQHHHSVAHCYRCDTIIEPLISRQWFIDVNKPVIKDGTKKKSIKQKAIEVVKKGQIEIIPSRFNKTYFHWTTNLRDWCISRQIWFGHRIPAWYCKNSDCKRTKLKEGHTVGAGNETDPIVPMSGKSNPKCCPDCKGEVKQDSDTLDTWFSAGLWTFSTLGWPDKTKDFKYFHPTSVLETGYDILFFWVARMIIMSTYHVKDVPFKKVYLHGLVRDKDGRKMSKSLGNGIDPLDMISKYGADALRLSMVLGATPGNDIRLYEEKIAGYRNFVNKIWNAGRFIIMNLEPKELKNSKIDLKKLQPADKWILSRMQKMINEVTKNLENYKFSEAGLKMYDFMWNEVCDWYLEMSKVQKNPAVLIYLIKSSLQILHPFMPFVTEVLWANLSEKNDLIIEPWPKFNKKFDFPNAEKELKIICETVTAIRSLRTENKVEPSKKIQAIIYTKKETKLFIGQAEMIKRLAGLSDLIVKIEGEKMTKAASVTLQNVQIYLPLSGLIDVEKEKKRFKEEIIKLEQFIKSLEAKLQNQGFLKNAPAAIVLQEKNRLVEANQQKENLQRQLNSF